LQGLSANGLKQGAEKSLRMAFELAAGFSILHENRLLSFSSPALAGEIAAGKQAAKTFSAAYA